MEVEIFIPDLMLFIDWESVTTDWKLQTFLPGNLESNSDWGVQTELKVWLETDDDNKSQGHMIV